MLMVGAPGAGKSMLAARAAYFLQEQDMTRYDAINFIVHGIVKGSGGAAA